jgi:Na+-driven multidrug efflux pump
MLTIFILIEPISKIITGIITGLGRQGIASIFTLVAYWVLGIPLTLIYVFDLNGGIFPSGLVPLSPLSSFFSPRTSS